ncbi:hypothetical protein Poli38472_014322 [Pythium oligandrum]|uniref:PAP-associated domain-containing protein n=1 Tax=Pythium oligandrum TaxID=41045 RepID=A0A8K1FE91_PYTOL|nr:hypothetical protein Poli38472_014322 [Pythium oligandrum]|eukprot:TMW57719.1 hypothetical protein Poli38472_014322 [Pythium oligandrum]
MVSFAGPKLGVRVMTDATSMTTDGSHARGDDGKRRARRGGRGGKASGEQMARVEVVNAVEATTSTEDSTVPAKKKKPHSTKKTTKSKTESADATPPPAPVTAEKKPRKKHEPKSKEEEEEEEEAKAPENEAEGGKPKQQTKSRKKEKGMSQDRVVATEVAETAGEDDEKKTTDSKKKERKKKSVETESDAVEVVLPVVDPVNWREAAWYVGCDSDLITSHTLLSRCSASNDTMAIHDVECVRRIRNLQALVQRVKMELLPTNDESNEASQWTVAAIVDDVSSVLANARTEANTRAPSPVVKAITHELIEAATELLLSRTTRDEIAVLEKWMSVLAVEDANEEKPQEEEAKPEEQVESKQKDKSRQKAAAWRQATAEHALHQCEQVVVFLRSGGHSAADMDEAALASLASMTPESAQRSQWSAEIQQIYKESCVQDADEAHRQRVAKELEAAFRRHGQWRQSQVLLFGSSLSKFGSKRSDLDLCLRSQPADGSKEGEGAAEGATVAMSSRELRLRMRRAQNGGDSIAETTDEDHALLLELLEKSRKSLEAVVNGLAKQIKKTKKKDAKKQETLAVFKVHWEALVEALQYTCDAFSMSNEGRSTQQQAYSTRQLHAQALAAQKRRQKDIYMAEALLKRNGCDVKLVIAHARVPVIRFTHRASDYECDLCFDNYLAAINTMLLRAYAEYDDRTRALGLVVKHWAKRRGVSDASLGYLSSYSYILLVIYYLQARVGLLPNLQNPELLQQANVSPRYFNKVDISFCDDRHAARAFHSTTAAAKNVQNLTVAELLEGFFAFYASEFDFAQYVVSVRSPESQQRKTKKTRWGLSKMKSWRISIEDPLEITRDLGCVLQASAQQRILKEFARANALMQKGESFADVVCAVPEEVVAAAAANANGPKKGKGKANPKPKQQQKSTSKNDNGRKNSKDGQQRTKAAHKEQSPTEPQQEPTTKKPSDGHKKSRKSREKYENSASRSSDPTQDRQTQRKPRSAPKGQWRARSGPEGDIKAEK